MLAFSVGQEGCSPAGESQVAVMALLSNHAKKLIFLAPNASEHEETAWQVRQVLNFPVFSDYSRHVQSKCQASEVSIE